MEGMPEPRQGQRLPMQTLEPFRVFGHLGRQELQGHPPAQAKILGHVDVAHAPGAQPLDDSVVREGLADHILGAPGPSIDPSLPDSSERKGTSPRLRRPDRASRQGRALPI